MKPCHPLALLTFGLYGEVLPNQDGAPIRIVVPWKYGFKSCKSIVRIRFTEKQPTTTWNTDGAQRVRLLLQRESERRSSALEPGHGAPHRRVLQAPDAHVQRLRRPGRLAVHGNGFEEVLLKTQPENAEYRKIAVTSQTRRRSWPAWFPLGRLAWKAYSDMLGANPIEVITHSTGDWTLIFLMLTLGDHPAAPAHRPAVAHPLPAHARPVRLLLCLPALHHLHLAGQVFRRARHGEGRRTSGRSSPSASPPSCC